MRPSEISLPIQWSDDWNLGIEEIDKQHRSLIEHFNDMKRRQQSGADSFNGDLLFMQNYIKTHFQTEERYMKEIGFPELESHVNEHNFLRDRVSEMAIRYSRGLDSSEKMIETIQRWIVNHILHSDMKLKDQLTNNESIAG